MASWDSYSVNLQVINCEGIKNTNSTALIIPPDNWFLSWTFIGVIQWSKHFHYFIFPWVPELESHRRTFQSRGCCCPHGSCGRFLVLLRCGRFLHLPAGFVQVLELPAGSIQLWELLQALQGHPQSRNLQHRCSPAAHMHLAIIRACPGCCSHHGLHCQSYF